MKKRTPENERVFLTAPLFVWLILAQGLCLGATTSQISQYGITWTFDRQYSYGRFANGDYWVVGPVRIIGIEPASRQVDGRTRNGSMVNPKPHLTGAKQGYDSHAKQAHSTYDRKLNVALEVGDSKPLVLDPGASLISCISVEEPDQWPQLEAAAVLTVVGKAPRLGSFRPPYCGDDKTIRFNKEDLDYNILESLVRVPNAPLLRSIEAKFERPWLDHVLGWTGSRFAPLKNMPSYGREFGTMVGLGALALHLDWDSITPGDKQNRQLKEKLYIGFVQLGIDLYGAYENGMYWKSDMGIWGGRKWPILFAGIALDRNANNRISHAMRSVGKRSGRYLYHNGYGAGNMPPDYIRFQEDEQTFYVKRADINVPHDAGSWSHPSPPGNREDNYRERDLGMPEWGGRHAWRPWQDTRKWNKNPYRTCCTANSWAGFLLAALIMEQKASAKQLWNHRAIFDYQDRYMDVERQVHGVGHWARQQSRFTEQMWDTYRPRYGPTWVRDDRDDIHSNGHYESPGKGQKNESDSRVASSDLAIPKE